MTPEEKKRNGYLLRTYGISLAEYGSLLDGQEGRCALCRKSVEEEGRNLAVDHNHITGEIRGLLCAFCNHRVIGRHRDPMLLRRMADYCERHTGLFVPCKKKATKHRRRKTDLD